MMRKPTIHRFRLDFTVSSPHLFVIIAAVAAVGSTIVNAPTSSSRTSGSNSGIFCEAFQAPHPLFGSRITPTTSGRGRYYGGVTRLHAALPPPLLLLDHSLSSPSSSLWLADDTVDLTITTMDDTATAFTDSINLFDGPVGIMAAVFGVVVLLTFLLKQVMVQMDSAIEQVLLDFETKMKRYYPKKWQRIVDQELDGLQGDARDVKLLQVMEQLQKDDPEFVTKLANRSGTETENESENVPTNESNNNNNNKIKKSKKKTRSSKKNDEQDDNKTNVTISAKTDEAIDMEDASSSKQL